MGHLINPISARLGFTSFWISNWSCFNLSNFSYNLMIDNLIRNFISWAFSENKTAFNLTVVGAFLSHFKILRRENNIRVFVFFILDSSRFFKSQSVELDPDAVNTYNSYRNYRKCNGLAYLSSGVSKDLVSKINKKIRVFNDLYDGSNYLLKQSFFKKIVLNFSSLLLSRLLSQFFAINRHFSRFKISVDPVLIKTTSFLNANFLSRFLARRLSYGFELNRVLRPLVVNLKKLVDSRSSKMIGFRISCRGRFNKAQMASYTWEKYGPIPLSNFSYSVSYSYSKVFLKYGACGIKVWVFTSHPIFRNYKSSVLRRDVGFDICSYALSNFNSSGFYSKFFGKGYFFYKVLILLRLFSLIFDVKAFLKYLFVRFIKRKDEFDKYQKK